MPFGIQQCAKIFGTLTAAGAGTSIAIHKNERQSDRKLSSSEQETWLQMSCDGSFWPRPRSLSETSIENNGKIESVPTWK